MKEKSNFKERVYELCRNIPKGKVTTYKEIGIAMGSKAYRAIGNALRENPYPIKIPCHRVVKNDGKLGGFKGKTYGRTLQQKIKILKKEGIIVKKNKIMDFQKKCYKFCD